MNIEFGVPQDSIWGTLLFIIYINDMIHVLKGCKIILYADDTLIYVEGEIDEQCKQYLLHDICYWLKSKKLKLNENKTKLTLTMIQKLKLIVKHLNV